jgi:hypothetical protein
MDTRPAGSTQETSARRTAEDVPLPGGDFQLFVQKLAYQALMTLGVVENPLTKKRDTNLAHAQMVIDDLMMLREKTQGNLKPEESQHLTQVVGELQRHFVALKSRG